MIPLFAIHSRRKNGQFSGKYYYTARNNVRKGDELYIISTEKPNPGYYLEGLFRVSGIRNDPEKNKRKLLLKVSLVNSTQPSINDQSWFDPEEFRRFFANGQSMNPVPGKYEPLFRELLSGDKLDTSNDDDAIDDLGSDHPVKALGVAQRYKRDFRVREAVLARANGICELCGKPGFICNDDTRYLEAHHIIALANDGADRPTNVIALCADDHRKAHFGRESDQIEKEMIRIVEKLASAANGQSHPHH